MEKEKLINEIDLITESIRMHVKRLKSEDYKVHKMDMDILIEKTKQLYDQLIHLDGITIPFETSMAEATEGEMDVKITEQLIEEEVVVEKKIDESMKEEIPQGMMDPEEQEVETVIQSTEKEVFIEEIQEPVDPEEQEVETVMHQEETLTEMHDEILETVEEKKAEKDQEIAPEEKKETKSTIDLFSTSAEPSLGERLKSDSQITIADKIKKEYINELREAIGINEKFLFINELFNGDMARYNKIIDELDALKTMEGVNTYMLELKIQSQWKDDNQALIKLTELLNRKFVNT
jgi:hypothetical protein